MSGTPPDGSMRLLLQEVERLSARGQAAAAEERARRLVREFPAHAESWLALARLLQRRNDLVGARECAEQGLGAVPGDNRLALLRAELTIQSGQVDEGLSELRTLVATLRGDGSVLQRAAQMFTRLNLHAEAESCHRMAVAVAPGDTGYSYNLATSLIALGKLQEAENLLDAVIATKPEDYDAWYNRSTLRRQAAERNHIPELEAALAKSARGSVQLGYALAKELEDLGQYRHAFERLERAAGARKKLLSYRVEDDERAMAEIAAVFDAAFFARGAAGFDNPRPIFIVGLPRSGSTLIDRILSSHSDVESLGEIGDFAAALMRAVPAARNKFELIAQAASADFASVGRAYCETTSALSPNAKRTIDKTPLNFLYLGLIARAMPNASIVHVRRGAMDVCYAMYKTLFRMAYPFSYDQSDLARYFLAYRRLMAHWRQMLPGRFAEVDYESLVATQESVTRRLVAACDLEWQDACLAPEQNTSPSLTASASQVREKVYRTSVGAWRRHADELAPLAQALREGGVNIEEE